VDIYGEITEFTPSSFRPDLENRVGEEAGRRIAGKSLLKHRESPNLQDRFHRRRGGRNVSIVEKRNLVRFRAGYSDASNPQWI
jgi:hypothetical protein